MTKKQIFIVIPLLFILVLLIVGFSLLGQANEKRTVIINEDVQLESSLADSSLQLIRKQDIYLQEGIKYYDLLGKAKDSFVYTLGNSIYTEKPGREPFQLVKGQGRSLSQDGSHLLYFIEDTGFVANIQTGKTYEIGEGSPESILFANKEGTYVIHLKHEDTFVLSAFLVNIETNKTERIELTHYFDATNLTISSVKYEKEGLYLLAHSLEDGYGLYVVKGGEKQLTLPLAEQEDQIVHYDLLANGDILFNGKYKGETGIFRWNSNNQSVTRLVSGGIDDEGEWLPFYKLSPDETKIVFDTPSRKNSEFATNVYLAEFDGEEVSNAMRILEHESLPAVVSIISYWHEDSSTLYIKTGEEREKDWDKRELGNIIVFECTL